jgi:hypothetical protein
MPRPGLAYTLAGDVADAHQQLETSVERTLVLEPSCTAVLLAARGTGAVNVTFDNTVASVTNGLPIVGGAQPVEIPLGYHAHADHTLRALGGASTFLDVVQLA